MNSFWDFIIWLFWFYVMIACIWVFITVIVDIFRDHTLNGWAKALWVLFLVFVPFLAALAPWMPFAIRLRRSAVRIDGP